MSGGVDGVGGHVYSHAGGGVGGGSVPNQSQQVKKFLTGTGWAKFPVCQHLKEKTILYKFCSGS